jgi:hypothetical protein
MEIKKSIKNIEILTNIEKGIEDVSDIVDLIERAIKMIQRLRPMRETLCKEGIIRDLMN